MSADEAEQSIIMISGIFLGFNRVIEELGYFPDERVNNILVGIGAPFLIKQILNIRTKLKYSTAVAFTAYAGTCGYYEYTKGFNLSEIQGDMVGVTVAFVFNAAIKR